MANGDIHVKYGDDGEPMFRMEGYPSPLIEDVVPGRATGLRDMDGAELFDGDRVVNLNIPSESERDCEIRRIRVGDFPPFWSAGGAGIEGGISLSREFGVRKVGPLLWRGIEIRHDAASRRTLNPVSDKGASK